MRRGGGREARESRQYEVRAKTRGETMPEKLWKDEEKERERKKNAIYEIIH